MVASSGMKPITPHEIPLNTIDAIVVDFLPILKFPKIDVRESTTNIDNV